ncbi:MAG TPA: SIS domain-containing protein, partial [Vicinamibacteria bacterium]
MTTLFETEIQEQPRVLASLVESRREQAERIGEAARAFSPRFVVVAARGSSDNAARYAQYLFGIRNGLTVALAAPSLFTHYAASPSLEGALVLGISQSGQSPDVVAVVAAARAQGALTVTLTNDPDSPLARAAQINLDLMAGPERAIAATKTYTTQLAALAMLSAAMSGGDGWDELVALPRQVEDTLLRNEGLEGPAERFASCSRLVVVGRGLNLATAFEIALKIKETTYVTAEPYSSADFLHGPIAMLDAQLPLFLVDVGERLQGDMEELARRARSAGAPLIVLSDRGTLGDEEAQARLELPAVPEWLSPVPAAAAGQLWAAA